MKTKWTLIRTIKKSIKFSSRESIFSIIDNETDSAPVCGERSSVVDEQSDA